MARNDPQFRIRLPEDLKSRVDEAALENSRSLNAEIVYRLSASFSVASRPLNALASLGPLTDVSDYHALLQAIHILRSIDLEEVERALKDLGK